MSIAISSPQFSFVSFNTPNTPCAGDNPSCLPVYDLSDLQFQVIAMVDGPDKGTFGAPELYAACITINDAFVAYDEYEQEFSVAWSKVATGAGTAPDTWYGFYQFNNLEALFTAMNAGDCFTLSLYNAPEFDGHNRGILATTVTCFYKVIDPCYTSLLVYANNSDAFGFDFSTLPGWAQMVRLPMYLHSPLNAEEEKSYAKSDGSTQKLSHRVWKDYKFKTDYLDEATIEKLTIATACDTVTITNPYSGITSAGFIRSGKVEVEWQEETMPLITLGQAKGVLRLADPRSYVNTNCS